MIQLGYIQWVSTTLYHDGCRVYYNASTGEVAVERDGSVLVEIEDHTARHLLSLIGGVSGQHRMPRGSRRNSGRNVIRRRIANRGQRYGRGAR